MVERIRPTLYTVLAAVGLLLLIACSNVANLMLARATAREKEFALRTVLGAGRTRIVRLLIVESLVLAIAGAALGIFLAWGGLKALVAALPPRVIPSESVIELNAPVLAVTLGIAVLTALMCGLAPALQSFRRDLSDPLRDSGKGTSGGFRGRRLRDAVVVMEVALSADAADRGRTADAELRRPARSPSGIAGGPYLHGGAAAARGPLRDGRAGDGIPAAAAGASQGAPRSRACGGIDRGRPRHRRARAGWRSRARRRTARRRPCFSRSPRTTSGLCGSSSRQGRPLSEADVNDARKVAVVNETFVRKYLPNERSNRAARATHRTSRRRRSRFTTPGSRLSAWSATCANRGLRAPTEPEVLDTVHDHGIARCKC